MRRITIFSFGYQGWGNATKQLVKGVDAVERARGKRPPVFVDVRYSRSVRALGFTGRSFEEMLGPRRHRWMKSLGNKQIGSRSGPRMLIADPTAAADLLALAVELDQDERRAIFFCSCGSGRAKDCHRYTVGTLLLKAACRDGVPLRVVEWPGDRPKRVQLNVPADVFRKLRDGRKSIPFGRRLSLAEAAGLPWGSVASIHSDGETIHRVVGPAEYHAAEQWCLPVVDDVGDGATTLKEYQDEVRSWRPKSGFDERVVL